MGRLVYPSDELYEEGMQQGRPTLQTTSTLDQLQHGGLAMAVAVEQFPEKLVQVESTTVMEGGEFLQQCMQRGRGKMQSPLKHR